MHDDVNRFGRVVPAQSFKRRFAVIADRLTLKCWLSEVDLARLCKAAFCAALCNICFNGLGGCGGKIGSSRETNRLEVERGFMAACADFWQSTGTQKIPEDIKASICRIFLNVFVSEENLAT